MKFTAQVIKSLEVMNVHPTPSPGKCTLRIRFTFVEDLWLKKDGSCLQLTATSCEYMTSLFNLYFLKTC